MATLWNRATPSQYRMLRAIAGAVRNAAHAHQIDITKNFARSVAKRATGTLTAQWPDVLAVTSLRRQNGSRDRLVSRDPRGSDLRKGRSEGAGLRLLRLAPIRFVWKRYAAGMWKVKHEGSPEEYAAHVRILKLLDEAQRELEALALPRPERDAD
jgi:hypothetical protein